MFRVDRTENRIARLTRRSFGELNLREREHLQEWLVHQPDALGEDLLIIQKEFDGFDETRERLDLLALDKAGNLVVIENKLDDTGRDVVWQALKYTAYVTPLKPAQIVEIYQRYLDRYCGGGAATEQICEFMGVDDLDEAQINAGNGQRMMLVAANFRREVTATVLWLLNRGISVTCFRAIPYVHGDDVFIDLQQIIPTPEAADYMIGLAAKEADESSTQGVLKHRHELRLKFWSSVLEQFRHDGVSLYANVSPSKDNWLNAGSGLGGCPFTLVFLQTGVKVQLSIQRSDTEQNKWIFDQLFQQRETIEAKFGGALDWRRLDHRKLSLICCEQQFDGFNPSEWPRMIDWLSVTLKRFEQALRQPLANLARSPRAQNEGV